MRLFFLSVLTIFLITGPGLADDRSGPGRRTILREGWGTVFFAPQQIQGDYQLTVNENGDLYTFKSDQGTVVIHEHIEDVVLHYPDFQAAVDFEPNSLIVTWGEHVHTFRRNDAKMTYEGPEGTVEFVQDDERMTIEGPKGTVEVDHPPGVYLVKSPAGETRVETLPSGFRVSGVRLSEHPYLRRGAVFSHDGVGIYVELSLIDPRNPLFRHLEWNTLLELDSSQR